ncbi:MAG: hypothetical protein ACO3C4_01775 [Candidatus Limnocylindrus sp.]
MPISVKDAGSWKSATPYVKDGGTWKVVQAGYVRDAGTWKQFFTNLSASISDQSALNYSLSGVGGTASATYRLANNGVASRTNVSGTLTAISGEWLVAGNASDFEAYMAPDGGGSGGTTSGTFNTWVNLGTTQDWTLTATNNSATRSFTLQIRIASSGEVVDTATISFEVDSAP